MNANWLPMSTSKIPSPRPGVCQKFSTKNKRFTLIQSNQSKEHSNTPTNYETRLNFIKHHALMDNNVPSYFRSQFPLYIKTSLGERLTVITVDSNILPANIRNEPMDSHYDVMFVGTTTGRILKLVSIATSSPLSNNLRNKREYDKMGGDDIGQIPILIESIQMFEFNIPIRNIMVHKNTSQLIALSDNQVFTILGTR